MDSFQIWEPVPLKTMQRVSIFSCINMFKADIRIIHFTNMDM